jgi:hypothetical protein
VSCIIGLLLYLCLEKRVNKYRESVIFIADPTVFTNKFAYASITGLLFSYLFLPIVTILYVYSLQNSGSHNNEVTAYNLTDKNWINGIGRVFSGFFIANTPDNIKLYKIGRRIKFANGDTREIVGLEHSDQFINIYVSGKPLDGEQVGFPNKLEIVK